MAIDSDDDDVLYSSANLDQDRTLIGGEAKNLDDIMNSPRHRMKKTFGLCAAFLGLGLSVSILGPTLHSLKDQIGIESMDTMAIVFSGRGLGYLGGTVIGGVFFDYWNPQVLIAASLALASLGLLVAAFTKSLMLLIALMATVGVAMGVLDTGANVVCIKMWGRRSSAFLQMLHFAFAVGACLSPLLATPFIRSDLWDTECTPNGTLLYSLTTQPPVTSLIATTQASTVTTMNVTSNATTQASTVTMISATTNATKQASTVTTLNVTNNTGTGVDDPCDSNNCLNGGSCTIIPGEEIVCTCAEGFTGPTCNDDMPLLVEGCSDMRIVSLNETSVLIFYNSPTLHDSEDSNLTVTCDPPYTVLHYPFTAGSVITYTCSDTASLSSNIKCRIDDPCDSNNCLNGGSCTIIPGEEIVCTCAEGFTGPTCNDDMPLLVEGCSDMRIVSLNETSVLIFYNSPTLHDSEDSNLTVTCDPPYTVLHYPFTAGSVITYTCSDTASLSSNIKCRIDDPCDSNNCLNGGSCTIIPGEEIVCTCAEGFTGPTCNDDMPLLVEGCSDMRIVSLDETSVLIFYNSPTLHDSEDSNLTVTCDPPHTVLQYPFTAGSVITYTCSDTAGLSSNITCRIDDPCDSNNCLNGGSCTIIPGEEIVCTCAEGFTGPTCNVDDPCGSNNCLNGGSCTTIPGKEIVCTCAEGFTGPTCNVPESPSKRSIEDVALPECEPACLNDGTCSVEGETLKCECVAGFYGDICEKEGTGFRGIYILISVYLFAVSLLFCYFTYLSPIMSTPTHTVKKSSERSSFEVKILVLLFCFYCLYVGGEVAFGGYITDYYRAMAFGDVCHATLAAAWFWATFAFGRGLAICLATVLTPWTMVVTDLTGGVISTAILVWYVDSPGWFWLGTGLLGLSIASLFPSGIAWLEGYVDVSGKVASVLVTGGVLGEMVLPLVVGTLMFQEKETTDEYETASNPEYLMYIMCLVCAISAGLFAYVFFLANELGLKNSMGKQNLVVDVFDGFTDAFRMADVDKKRPKQLKKPVIIVKKHKL